MKDELITENLLFLISFIESIDIIKTSFILFYLNRYNASISLLRNSIESTVNGAFFNYIIKNINIINFNNLKIKIEKNNRKKKNNDLFKELFDILFMNRDSVYTKYTLASYFMESGHEKLPTVFNREGLSLLEEEFHLTSPIPVSHGINRYVKYHDLSKNSHENLRYTDIARAIIGKIELHDEKEYFKQRLSEYHGYFSPVADAMAILFLNTFERDIKSSPILKEELESIFEEDIAGTYGVWMKYTYKKIKNILKTP